jgi:hypothetical protein
MTKAKLYLLILMVPWLSTSEISAGAPILFIETAIMV